MRDFKLIVVKTLFYGFTVFGTRVAAEAPTDRFGFKGLEIFPIDNQISLVRASDINGDGLVDLVLVNNARAKINLLINQTGQTNRPAPAKTTPRKELNELPVDARFRIDSIASEKRIAALVVTDLNSDGRPDLAYFGEPKELVVQYNLGTNGWGSPKRWQIGDDTSLSPNSLATGDLNNDGRVDLLLLAESHIFYLAQNANYALEEPEKIPFAGTVKSIQALDIDGDKRDDLLLVNWDDPNPFRFRLQTEAGQLGPENHFPLPAIRAYWADDLDGDSKTEVMGIAQNSGRAQVSNFALKDSEPLSGEFRQGQFQIFPLNRTGKTRRGVAWGDVNADKLLDLLVAEPDSGQLALYLQKADGSLNHANTFPTFTGVSDLAVTDWDGDGKSEIFVLSVAVQHVGLTRFCERGRLNFALVVPFEGKPLVMATGRLEPSAKPVLAVISEMETNRVLVIREASGKTRVQKLSDAFKANPASLTFHDADQDGLADLVALIPYEKIKILRQVPGADFEELDIMPPGGNVAQPWLSIADVDGDGKTELLLAQKNFLRAVVLNSDLQREGTNKPSGNFVVKEQINGSASNSRIVAAVPMKNGTNTIASLFLLDAEKKVLTLSERDQSGVWQVVRNMPLPMADFHFMQTIGLGAEKPNSLAFVGINAGAWMHLGGKVWDLVERDHYETPIKDARLNDLISGDLNNDGRKDLVFLETAKNYVDLVMFEPPHKLVPANRWPVFEERTFRSRRGEMAEPREAVIADFTGDGRNDLAVLVHDRILLYPQE